MLSIDLADMVQQCLGTLREMEMDDQKAEAAEAAEVDAEVDVEGLS
jgi:hypothetical protein